MLNVMLDIETLGFDVNCIVPQVAAVAFDDEFQEWGYFNATMSIKVMDEEGFTNTPSTMKFWSEQPKEVQKVVLGGKEHPGDAMQRFASWLVEVGEEGNRGNFRLWTNHLLFDVPKTDYLMDYFGQKPISDCTRYDCIEDFASVKNEAIRKNRDEYYSRQGKIEKGDLHNALDDCRWQIKALEIARDVLHN